MSKKANVHLQSVTNEQLALFGCGTTPASTHDAPPPVPPHTPLTDLSPYERLHDFVVER